MEGPGEDVKARPGRVGIACHWPEQFTAPIASGVGGGGNGHSLSDQGRPGEGAWWTRSHVSAAHRLTAALEAKGMRKQLQV